MGLLSAMRTPGTRGAQEELHFGHRRGLCAGRSLFADVLWVELSLTGVFVNRDQQGTAEPG